MTRSGCCISIKQSRITLLFVITFYIIAADFAMGVYLLIIATHDAMFRGEYNNYAFNWMENWTCQATGFIALTSCEVSTLILTTMSVDCYLTVSNPYSQHYLTAKTAVILLSAEWIIGATIAALPIVLTSSMGNVYGSNGVCLPLHIHEPYAVGWQYSAFLFLGVNLSAILVVLICYSRMCCELYRKSKYFSTNINDQEFENRNVTKRVFAIVLTNFVCWIPLSVTKIVALTNYRISGMSLFARLVQIM